MTDGPGGRVAGGMRRTATFIMDPVASSAVAAPPSCGAQPSHLISLSHSKPAGAAPPPGRRRPEPHLTPRSSTCSAPAADFHPQPDWKHTVSGEPRPGGVNAVHLLMLAGCCSQPSPAAGRAMPDLRHGQANGRAAAPPGRSPQVDRRAPAPVPQVERRSHPPGSRKAGELPVSRFL